MSLQAPKQDFFERLEGEANDDFRLLDELGPSHFGTEHLIELHRELRAKLALFSRKQRLTFALLGSVVGWLMLIGLARFMGYRWLALATYCFLALSCVVFLSTLLASPRRYLSKGHLEYDLRLIEGELRKRGVRNVEQRAGRKN